MNFQDRIALAFKREGDRRQSLGEKRLNKTDLWRGAGLSSGAATQWFTGPGGMAMETCFKVAPILRVNPFWLFDESRSIDDAWDPRLPRTLAQISEDQNQKSIQTPDDAIELHHLYQHADSARQAIVDIVLGGPEKAPAWMSKSTLKTIDAAIGAAQEQSQISDSTKKSEPRHRVNSTK